MNILIYIKGKRLKLKSRSTLFSPRKIDPGTLAMLSEIYFQDDDKVLDLGCGYGVVGIYAAKNIGAEKVVMCDIDKTAVLAAKNNAVMNQVEMVRIICCNAYEGFADADFTKILSNPPYHSDFSTAKKFIEEGYRRLAYGGNIYMVTKRKDWYKNKFITVFGGVRIRESNGYYVFTAEKRKYSNRGKGEQ